MTRLIASKVISYVLGSYVEALDSNQLELSIFGGDVSFKDLTLKSGALASNGVPVNIHNGIIQSLSAKFPWLHLGSQAVAASLKGLYIFGTIDGNVLLENDMKTPTRTASELDELCEKENLEKKDVMTGIVGTIIDNLVVDVSDIHIRIEFKLQDKIVSAGIIIPSIQIYTIDEKGNKTFVSQKPKILRKKVLIKNMSIYLDTNNPPINSREFIKEITALSKGEHQYILKDFTFDTVWEHNNESSLITDNFIADIPIIDIALDRLQWYAIDQLQWQNYMFSKQRLYRGCGRPDRPVRSERSSGVWWLFANNAAKVKSHPQYLDTQSALAFLKNRKQTSKFLTEYISSTNRTAKKAEFTKLQDQYGLNVLYNMMTYNRFIIDKSKSKSQTNQLDVSSEELRSLSSQGQNKTSGISANLLIHKVQATLNTFPGQPLVQLLIEKIGGVVNMKSPMISAKASIGSFSVVDILDDSPRKLIDFVPRLDSNCMNFEFSTNTDKRQTNVKAFVSSPEIIGDLPKITFISNFFKTPEKGIYVDPADPPPKRRDSTKSEILELLEKHPFNFVDLEIETPHILIPFKSPIHINLDSIKVHVDPSLKREYTNQETWYDHAKLDVRNFSLTFDEKKIILPFSTSVALNVLYIPMASIPNQIFNVDINAIEVNFTRSQYLSILEMIKEITNPPPPLPLLDEDKKPQKRPPPRQKVVKNENGLSMLLNLNFKRLDLRLFNINDIEINMFTIGSISSSLLFVEDSIKCNFTLLNVLATDIEKNAFFRFGGDESKAIEISLNKKPEDTIADLLINVSEPFFLLDFTWVFMLREFFIVHKPKQNIEHQVEITEVDNNENKTEETKIVPKTQEKPKMGLKGVFNIKNPNVAVAVPSKHGKIIVKLNINDINIDLDVLGENQKLHIIPNDVVVMINGEKVVLPFTPSVDINFGEKKNIDVNLNEMLVNFDTNNYYFILDMLDYVLKRLNRALTITDETEKPQATTKEVVKKEENVNSSPMNINVNINNVKIDVVHLGTKILNLDVNDIKVLIPPTEIQVLITDIIGTEFMTTLSNEWMNAKGFHLILGSPMKINFEEIYFSGKTAPIAWAINFFTKKPESIIVANDDLSLQVLQTPETKQQQNTEETPSVFQLLLEIGKVNIPLVYPDGKVLATVLTDKTNLDLKIEPDTGLDMHVYLSDLKIDTDMLGTPNPHFIYLDENEKFHFHLANKFYGVEVPHLNVCYSHRFLFDLLKWSSGLSEGSEKTEWKDSPMQIPTSSYEILTEKLKLRLVPYEPNEEFPGVDLILNKFNVKTEQFPTDLKVTTEKIDFVDKNSKKFMTINDFVIPVFLDLRNEPQPVKEGFDPKIREEFIGKSDGFFYGIKVTPSIGSIEYDLDQYSTLQFCHSLATFTSLPPAPQPETPVEVHETAFVGLYTTVIADLKSITVNPTDTEKFGQIVINGLGFAMEEGKIGINLESMELNGEQKVLSIGPVNDVKNGISLKLDNGDIKVILGSFFFYLDYKFVSRFYLWLKKLPYLTFDFFPNTPKAIKAPEDQNQTEEKKKSMINADAVSMNLVLPIDPEKPDIMCIDLALSFEMSPEKMVASLHKLNIAMAPGFNEKRYPSIVILQNIVYTADKKDGKARTLVETQTVRVSISPIDIASIIVLQGSIMKLSEVFIERSCVSYEKPEKVEVDESKNGSILAICTGACWLDICAENRLRDKPMPLLRITTEPLDVEIDMSAGSVNKFTTKSLTIEHYDHKTFKFSKVLEPTTFQYLIAFNKDVSRMKVRAIRDMNINITHKELKDILKLVNQINTCVAEKKITSDKMDAFKLYNNLGMVARFEIGDHQVELAPMSIYRASDSVNGRVPISLFFKRKQFTFTTDELYYPRFLTNNIIVSYQETPTSQRLLFSTPIKFHNNTPIPLTLFIHGKRNRLERAIEIDPDLHCNLPADVSPTCNMGLGFLEATKNKYSYFSVKTLKESNFIYKIAAGDRRMKVFISSKLDFETSVLNVEISPQVTLRNDLMHPITVCIGLEKDKGVMETAIIQPNEEIFAKLSISNLSKLLVKVKVGDNPFSEIVDVPPQTKKSPIKCMVLENSTFITLVADTNYDEDTQAFKISFYAPTVIFNKSGLDLMVADSTAKIAAEFASINEGDDPTTNGYVYWGNNEYFDTNSSTLHAYLLLHDEWALSKAPLQTLAAPISEDYFTQIASCPDLYAPIHYMVEMIHRTAVVTLQPYIVIENLCTRDFRLDPIYSIDNPIDIVNDLEPIIIQKGQKKFLKYSGEKLAFRFRSLTDTGFWSHEKGTLISLDAPVHTTFMDIQNIVHKLQGVELEIKGDGHDFIATFRDAKPTQPLTITNYFKVPIMYKQIDGEILVQVNPEMTTYVMLEKPFELNDVIILAQGLEIPVNLADIERSIKFKHPNNNDEVWVHIEINEKCRKTIAIADKPVEQPTRHCWNMSVQFDNFNISLIDQMRELCVLNIHGINLKYVQNDRFTNASFAINSMQLDDMCVPRDYGVVLAAYPNDGHNWFEARCSMFGDAPLFTAFSFISVRVQPIMMSVDLSFVSDMWNFIKPLLESEGNQKKVQPAEGRTAALTSSDFTAQKLKIHQVDLNFSIFSNTARVGLHPLLTQIIKFVPSVSGGSIVLPELPISDFTATGDFISERIVQPYIKQVTSQALKLLFNTNMLFAIHEVTSNISRQGTKLAKGDIKAIGGATVGTVFAAAGGVTRTLANVFHTVSGQEAGYGNAMQMGAGDSINHGLGSIYKNVASNSFNAVNTALAGAAEDGAIGAVLGLGKGIGNMVMSPLAGLLDASSSILSGASKFVNDDDLVYKSLRIPRCFADGAVEEFQKIPAMLQLMIFDGGYTSEQIELLVKDISAKDERYIAITKTKVFIIRVDVTKELEPLPISTCKAAYDGTKVVASFKNAKGVLKFITKSELVAKQTASFLTSRRNELNIGEDMDFDSL